jgi:hypothetical protein
MVLVVEDMHWADRSTRDLLAFLIRNQPSLDGLLIVTTYRSDELPARTCCARCWPNSTVSPGSLGWTWAASPARTRPARRPAHRPLRDLLVASVPTGR